MASKSKKSESRERHRLPPEQQRELNKDGRCRRILCDILRLRVLAYIARQPAPFMFILSLFLISITLPLVGLYISRVDGLPDLDAMQNWNAYIGRLGRKDFCFNVNKSEMSGVHQLQDVLSQSSILSDSGDILTVGVIINFTVDKAVLTPANRVLHGNFTGKDFTTQIRDSSGKRIDDEIHIHLLLNTSAANLTQACPGESTQCKVETCVLITAPWDAVPTRLPQVHHNATFSNKVYGSDTNRRPKECSLYRGIKDQLNADRSPSLLNGSVAYYNISARTRVRNIILCSKADKDTFDSLYLPAVHRGASKGHGIIRINLNKEDQQTAANHMYIAALAIAALAVAFAISIAFTDRPPQPKSSQE